MKVQKINDMHVNWVKCKDHGFFHLHSKVTAGNIIKSYIYLIFIFQLSLSFLSTVLISDYAGDIKSLKFIGGGGVLF